MDEETILYNNVLNQQLVADSSSWSSASLYGVSINLAVVERKFRTPKELKEQLAEKEQLRADIIKLLNDLWNQHEEEQKNLKGKYQLQIRKQNESLHAKKAEMQLLPQTEKKLKIQSLELKNRLEKWRSQGVGPRFHRFGNRIRYHIDDLAAWTEQTVHVSTSL